MFSVTDSSLPDLQDSFMKSDIEEGMPQRLSTFLGKPARGGWIPVFTMYEDGAPVITDWICPKCVSLTSLSRTCPKCGLEKQEIPIYKDLQRPEREHKSNYKLWIQEQLKVQDASGIQRGPTTSQPKADPERRTDQEATGRRREAHASTRA